MLSHSIIINNNGRLTIDRRLKVGKTLVNVVLEQHSELARKKKILEESKKIVKKTVIKERIKLFVPDEVFNISNPFKQEVKQRRTSYLWDKFLYNLFAPATKIAITLVFLIIAFAALIFTALQMGTTTWVTEIGTDLPFQIVAGIFSSLTFVSILCHFYLWL